MPPNDADQVRKEMMQVTELCQALDHAAKAGHKFRTMQRELLGKLDPNTHIATTTDYTPPKYDKRKQELAIAVEKCRLLLCAPAK